jgi:hypothetical protein
MQCKRASRKKVFPHFLSEGARDQKNQQNMKAKGWANGRFSQPKTFPYTSGIASSFHCRNTVKIGASVTPNHFLEAVLRTLPK